MSEHPDNAPDKFWSGRELLDDVKRHAELFTAGDFERMLAELADTTDADDELRRPAAPHRD